MAAQVSIHLKVLDQASKEFSSSLAKISASIKQLEQRQSSLRASAQTLNTAFVKSTQGMNQLSSGAKQLSLPLKNLSGNLKSVQADASLMGQRMSGAEQKSSMLRSTLASLAAVAGATKTALFAMGTGVVSLGKFYESVRTSVKNFGQSLESMGGRLNVFGQRLTFFIGLPIALFFKNIIQEGVAWDRQLVNLSRVTGLTSKETELLGKKILDLGSTIPITREALGDIALNAGKAGIGFDKLQAAQAAAKDGNIELSNQLKSEASQEMLDFTRVAGLATVAMTDFGGNGDEVSKRLIQLGAIFKVQTKELENFGSAVDTVADASNISSQDIVDTLSRISNARLFDMPAQDAIAFAATMVEITQVASRTGTEFNSAFKFLADNIESAAKVAGMSSETFKDLFDTNATDAVLAYSVGLSKIESNTERVTQANSDLGAVGAKAVLPLLENLDRFNALQKLSNSAWEENTRLITEAARQSNSIGGQWDILMFGLNRLKLMIFDTFKGSLVPILREANNAVAEFMGWFERIDGSQQQKLILISSAIGSILIVGGPLLILFGLMLQSIGSVIALVATLVGPIGLAGLAIALTGTYVLFNQVIESVSILGGGWKGLAATAVLIANAFGLINNSKTDEFLQKLGFNTNECSIQIDNAKKKIDEWKVKIYAIRDAIIDFKNKIIEVKDKIILWFSTIENKYHILEKLHAVFLTIVGVIRDDLIPQFQKVGKVFSDNAPQLKLVAEIIGVILVGAILTAIGVVLGLVSAFASVAGGIIKIVGGLVDVFKGGFDLIYDICTGQFDKIGKDLGGMWDGMLKIWNGSMDAFIGSVLNFVTTIYDYFVGLYDDLIGHSIVPDIVNGIIAEFTHLADSAWDLGKNIVQGLINGVTGLAGDLKDSAVNMANTFISKAKETFQQHSPSKVFEQMGKFNVQGLINGTLSMADELNQAMAKLGTDAGEDIAKSLYEKSQDMIQAQTQLNNELKKSGKTRNQDTINSLNKEISDGKAFMDLHKADYTKYQKEINEVASKASHDNVDILKDELTQKENLLRTSTITDLMTKLVNSVRDAGAGFKGAFDTFIKSNNEAATTFRKNSKQIYTDMDTVSTNLATTLEGIQTDFKSKATDIVNTFNSAMGNLKTDFANNIAGEIVKAQSSIGDNQTKIAQEIVSSQDSLANHQQELAALQAAANASDNADKITELQATIATEQAYLSKHNDYVTLLQSQITDVRKQNSMDAIDIIAAQITEEQTFLNNHVQDQQNYADQIAEINRASSLDSIQILKEQYAQQSLDLAAKLASDLLANDTARQTELTNARAAANIELGTLQAQLNDAKKVVRDALDENQAVFEASAKSIRKTFKKAFAGIQEVIDSLNSDGLTKNFKKAINLINEFITGQNATGNFKLKLLSMNEFAKGGIVPGSFSQASVAKVHGSEMILNPSQQNSLFGLLNGKISSQQQSVQAPANEIKVENHYHYDPHVGNLIATPGEQKDFLRRMNKLQADSNVRYGISTNLAFQ